MSTQIGLSRSVLPLLLGRGDHLQAVQLGGEGPPGRAGGGLHDPDQQQRQPAQHDVGADAFLQPVVDRAQIDDLLQVAPAPLDLEELLVAQRDVLGRQAGIAGAQQVLAVEVGLGLDRGLVDAQQPAGVTRR